MAELLPEMDFYQFMRALHIDSKEAGIRSLGECLLGSQQILLDKIREGLKDGCHEFITLKCRQLGCSTLSLAIDLYNAYSHPAINGALVTHDEAARNQFRTTLALYRSGLEEEWQREVVDDNRDQLVFDNGSRLRFLVAGTRARASGSSRLGRSGALIQCHSTEVAFWGDDTGVDALRASFAQINPLRFFHWESTANGENWFCDMWREAQSSMSVKTIFVSWWANDYYGLTRDSKLYEHYWGPKGRMTRDEAAITKEVNKRYYGDDINDCQWAWYRWMCAEKITDAAQMQQEFPHLEEDAFISTGSAFFRARTLFDAKRIVKAHKKHAEFYRVECGQNFSDTTLTKAGAAVANLTVWAEPAPDGWYVLGVDPAYASNPDSDFSVISVWRCWYNRLEQVAEFADRNISTHATAWVMTYLAGYYLRSTLNLEINGPGTAVLQEFQNLKRAAASGRLPDSGGMRKIVGAIRQYLFRRPDSNSGPTNFLHTKTTAELSERMMNALRDYLERAILLPASAVMLEEMHSVRRNDTGSVGAPDGKNDDRVIAAALAVMCWNDQLRTTLLTQGVMWREPRPEVESGESPGVGVIVDNTVARYLTRIGIVPPGSPPPPKKTVLIGTSKFGRRVPPT